MLQLFCHRVTHLHNPLSPNPQKNSISHNLHGVTVDCINNANQSPSKPNWAGIARRDKLLALAEFAQGQLPLTAIDRLLVEQVLRLGTASKSQEIGLIKILDRNERRVVDVLKSVFLRKHGVRS